MISPWIRAIHNRQGHPIERGAVVVEYGLLLTVVLLVAVLTVALFGSTVVELFVQSDGEYREIRPASALQGDR